MNAEQTRFYNHLLSLAGDPEALIAAAMEEHTARVEAENKLHEVSKGQTALSKEHQRVKKERDEAVKEKNRLDAVVKKLVAQLNERNRDCFGRRSEKADAMAGAASETNEDPLSEDSPPDPTSRPNNFNQAAAMLAGGKGGPGKGGTAPLDHGRIIGLVGRKIVDFQLDTGILLLKFCQNRPQVHFVQTVAVDADR